MNFFRTYKNLIFILLSLLILGYVLLNFSITHRVNNMDNFVCKAKVMVQRGDAFFKGVIDIKVIDGDGALHVNGFITTEKMEEFVIQRTVLFTAEKYRSSPMWVSNKIVLTHLDNSTPELITKMLPSFYVEPTTVSNIGLVSLDDGSMLITKSHLPYLFCIK